MEDKWTVDVDTVTEENVSIEEQLMEQPRNYELTELQTSLRGKIVTHISQNTERQRLPNLHQLQSKPVKDILNDANVIRTIPTNLLKETKQLMYSTATIITMELG